MSLIKIINLPIKDTEFKIVQLLHSSEPVMLCGSRKLGSRNFHYAILEDYLKNNEIKFERFACDPINFPEFLIPKLEKDRVYTVVGMGYAGINQPSQFFQLLYGSSHDYNIGVNPEFKEMLREMFKDDSKYWEELKNSIQ